MVRGHCCAKIVCASLEVRQPASTVGGVCLAALFKNSRWQVHVFFFLQSVYYTVSVRRKSISILCTPSWYGNRLSGTSNDFQNVGSTIYTFLVFPNPDPPDTTSTKRLHTVRGEIFMLSSDFSEAALSTATVSCVPRHYYCFHEPGLKPAGTRASPPRQSVMPEYCSARV